MQSTFESFSLKNIFVVDLHLRKKLDMNQSAKKYNHNNEIPNLKKTSFRYAIE